MIFNPADLVCPALFKQRAHIAGQWVEADGGAIVTVRDPAGGAIIGTVPDCGGAETERAIDAAAKALPSWRARTADERAHILERWHALVLEHVNDLARIMTGEQGKPLAEAKGEIRYAATFIKCSPRKAVGSADTTFRHRPRTAESSFARRPWECARRLRLGTFRRP